MTTMYQVNATRPTAGIGSSTDSRTVGPFESRKIAEDAAARLVDDPRRYANIRIESLSQWEMKEMKKKLVLT